MKKLFEKDFETGELNPSHIGRLKLSSGNMMRILLTPSGMKVVFPRSSMTNSDILFFQEPEGLGFMPEKKIVRRQNEGTTSRIQSVDKAGSGG